MATKKINLNELKTIIKQIIKEQDGKLSGRGVSFEPDYRGSDLGDLRKLIKDRVTLKLVYTKDYFKMKELLKQGWIVVSEDKNDPDHTMTMVKKPVLDTSGDTPVDYMFSDRRLEN